MRQIKGSLSTKFQSFPLALVVSNFNQAITDALKAGALERAFELGFVKEHITLVEVPGAVEIPYVVQILAQKGQVQAIIALGAVIRGETSHYDYVCEQVSQGCQRVMLDHGLPVVFGVLTTENEAQAWERLGGAYGHKGKDAVDVVVLMKSVTEQL